MTIDPGASAQAAVYNKVPTAIRDSVRAAARRTGVDFSYLMEKAAAESSFDTHAQASTSSAKGLFQFTDETWLDMVAAHGAKYGLGSYADAIKGGALAGDDRARLLAYRDDPRLSAAMAAEYTKDNADRLQKALGRPAGATDLYLAHFLGGSGATKFLSAMRSNADAPAADLMPQAAKANQAVFYANGRARSLGEIYDYFSGKFSASARIPLAGGAAPAHAQPALHMAQAAVLREPDGKQAPSVLAAATKSVGAPEPAHPSIQPAGLSVSSRVRPVPRHFSAPPSPNSQLGMAAVLYLASLDPLPKSGRRI